jgi:hypothetical protein
MKTKSELIQRMSIILSYEDAANLFEDIKEFLEKEKGEQQ